MTKEGIEEIVAVWQGRLRLQNWHIKVRWEKEVEFGADAEIKISDDYEQASIRIQQGADAATGTESFETWSDWYANKTIVHELLHIFEKQTGRAAETTQNTMSNQCYELFWAWYSHGAENWVDRLAVILVDLAGVV